MEFRKIEDEIEGCVFKKIDNRKIRKICHDENLENRKRECDLFKKYSKRSKTRKTPDY